MMERRNQGHVIPPPRGHGISTEKSDADQTLSELSPCVVSKSGSSQALQHKLDASTPLFGGNGAVTEAIRLRAAVVLLRLKYALEDDSKSCLDCGPRIKALVGTVKLETVGDLRHITVADLAEVKGCGAATIRKIVGFASSCGITIAATRGEAANDREDLKN